MTTLLIPGTQATRLNDQHGTVVYNAVRVEVGLQKYDLGGRPISEWARLLSMEHAEGKLDPVRTTLEPGAELRPGAVVVTPYQLFPHAYEEWSYDWRADLRWNAIRLLSEVRARVAGGEGRFNLIGHSQGGLLIVLATSAPRLASSRAWSLASYWWGRRSPARSAPSRHSCSATRASAKISAVWLARWRAPGLRFIRCCRRGAASWTTTGRRSPRENSSSR